MEEQEPSGNMDHSETTFPSPHSPTTDVCDETGNSVRSSPESGAKRPALAQRLAEAFRDGVASARPDCDKRPAVGTVPGVKKNRLESSDTGIRDRVIREGGTAAAVVGEKAAGVLGAFGQWVKKAPALTQKYAEAFRDGAASVKPRGERVQGDKGATAAKEQEAPTDARMVLERVFKTGESVAGFVRDAVSVVKPGEVIGVRQKIRLGEKKINQLYIDIGGEVAESWRDGLVETDKLAALLDELRKSEEDVLNLQANVVESTAAGQPAAARRAQAAKKAEAFTPPAEDKEDRCVAAGDADAKLDKPVEPLDQGIDQPLLDDSGKEALSESENRPDVAPDPVVAELSVSVEPDPEAPESHAIPEAQIDPAAQPQDQSGGGAEPALEPAIAIHSLPANPGQQESDSVAGPALPEEPEARQEKKDEREKDRNDK
jgi:hypothetical protein